MDSSHPMAPVAPLEVHYMSRKEMEPLILGTGASFTDVASQQTELYEGRETRRSRGIHKGISIVI